VFQKLACERVTNEKVKERVDMSANFIVLCLACSIKKICDQPMIQILCLGHQKIMFHSFLPLADHGFISQMFCKFFLRRGGWRF